MRWRAGRGTVLAVGALLAGLFFAMEHLPDASARSDYAPDADDMRQAQERGDSLRRLGILGLAGLGAAGLIAGTAGRPAGGGLLGNAVTLWAGWTCASLAWSTVPGVTLRRLVLFALALWTAAGVCKLLSGRQLVWAALICVGLHFGSGVLTELALGTFRPWRGDYRFAGTIHPNMQAVQLGIGVVACVSLLLRPGSGAGRTDRTAKARWLGLAGTAAAMTLFCLLTKSRTSVFGLAAAGFAAAVFCATGPTKALLTLWGGGLAGAAVVVLMLTGLDPTDEARDAALMGRSDDSGSLSGRVEIWDALNPYVAAKPVLGYGYGAFWTEQHTYALHEDVGFKFSASHSAWYETVLGTGLPGAALLAALLLGGLAGAAAAERAERRAAGFAGSPLPAFLFGGLVLAVLNSLLEAIVAEVRLVTFLLLCGLVKVTFLPDRPVDPPAPRPAPRESPPAEPPAPPAAAAATDGR